MCQGYCLVLLNLPNKVNKLGVLRKRRQLTQGESDNYEQF